MEKKIALVDYGRGNLRSVEKALQCVGAQVTLLASPKGMEGFDGLVLPGVGSFGDCAKSLRERGLTEPISNWLRDGRPFLGICLGYQILFERSEESPEEKGMGFFAGTVRKFSAEKGFKVPHMGWNQLRFPDRADDGGIYSEVGYGAFTYFVHSYYPDPEDASLVTAWCDYEVPFAASCGRGKVQGVQFHPEKSQAIGLKILGNFVGSLVG